MIPIFQITRQYAQFQQAFDDALVAVAASGQYILGPQVSAFEAEAARYLGVRHAIGCASGTDALVLALKALRIGPGDEVITTPFTFIATSEAIVQVGATPVFVDIDPQTFNLDVARIEALITPRTRAILPVHLYGLPADMAALQALAHRHGLWVVEDCAQAMGADVRGQKVGSFGNVGCFSFFPTKNLGAFGDGGLLTTQDDALADRLRMLRVHGSRKRYYHEESGLNSRLDEMQAAVLRVKLPHLDAFNDARRRIAARYSDGLQPLSDWLTRPSAPPDALHAFHQYTIQLRTDDLTARDRLQEALAQAGVGSMIYYPIPLYDQQTHAGLGCDRSHFPVCERLRARVLSLPMFPELTDAEIQQVIDAVTNGIRETVGATASSC
ncbi:MAG: DegT/DnrJ/EryC1/StrS family aminotransferase [Vampirovibrionales bacterium]|nr:DegT/DnrJ/EryC1/StrS family aminotransferase [Vampirovibrionales bacterium]